MDMTLIKTGHGYETGSRGRCDAFDGYKVLAAPLHQEGEGWKAAFGDQARENRIFRRKSGNGTNYSSHAIKLAKGGALDSELFLLVHHGGGREVWKVPAFYDGGDLEAHILAMPERLQYALLYTMYSLASETRRQAERETAQKWAQAYSDGRIKKRRATNTRAARVEIIAPPTNDVKTAMGTTEADRANV
ncbi:MAG: hypothetical protein DI604_25050 [Delftia acidovorans]|nr:MAG: hypothetical protein DI604_25050 [Delftia acidovorans]